jgi:hypothetical protein
VRRKNGYLLWIGVRAIFDCCQQKFCIFTIVAHKLGYFSTMIANNAVHSPTPSLLKILGRTDHD